MRGEMKSRVAMSFPRLPCSPNRPRCSHCRIVSDVGPVGDAQVHRPGDGGGRALVVHAAGIAAVAGLERVEEN